MSKSNRNRTSIPILGLDTSTPDIPVKDGTQEALHNLRHANGAWRDIKPFLLKHRLTVSDGNIDLFSSLEIRYSHPASGEGVYIASTTNPDGTINLSQIIVQDNDTISVTDPDFAKNLPADIQITHFGSILLLTDKTGKSNRRHYLINGSYQKFTPPISPVIYQTTERIGMQAQIASQNGAWHDGINYFVKHPIYNTTTKTYSLSASPDGESWHGEICLFAAYHMSDGTYISPSALQLCSAELDNNTKEARAYTVTDRNGTRTEYLDLCTVEYRNKLAEEWSDYDHEFFIRLPGGFIDPPRQDTVAIFKGSMAFYIKPKLRITLPGIPDKHFLKNITLFATRINPIYDGEKMDMLSKKARKIYENTRHPVGEMLRITDLTPIYADNDLPNQPFYKVKDIEFNDFKDGVCELELTYGLLHNIETNPAYEATQSMHEVYFSGMKEYNNRAHFYDLTSTLFHGYTEDMIQQTPEEASPTQFYTRLEIGSKHYITANTANQGIEKVSKILSYPDFRAKELQIFSKDKQVVFASLKPASALNVAFAWRTAEEFEEITKETGSRPGVITERYVYVKHPCFVITPKSATPPAVSDLLVETNRLQASGLNNPFNMPFANSYAIGSDNNRIRAVNSAAIEMSDAKFGEFPLYAFTDEGLFALQSGSGEVLYAAIIPLNYDRIINPETLAVNYNILYITSRGLHGMFSSQSTLLSEPINTPDNLPRLNFLSTARMCYQHKFSEIILYNPDLNANGRPIHPMAYVFSRSSKTWSTREFNGYKLNTDEIINRIDASSIEILDLNDERSRDKSPVLVTLISRPLKLGDSEFKRLETLIPRWWSDSPQPVRVEIEGSPDLQEWFPLHTTQGDVVNGDITMRRTPFSARYLRVRMETAVSGNFEITGYDLEYYLRFLHRLR